jgi:hypothetical protein
LGRINKMRISGRDDESNTKQTKRSRLKNSHGDEIF